MKTLVFGLFACAMMSLAVATAQANSPTVEGVQQVIDSTIATTTRESADKK
jgi:ABC-type transporter MlaC component